MGISIETFGLLFNIRNTLSWEDDFKIFFRKKNNNKMNKPFGAFK